MLYLKVVGLLVTALCSEGSFAASQDFEISGNAFDLGGARRYEFREYAGRRALCLDGVALLRNRLLREGSVTVDIASSREL